MLFVLELACSAGLLKNKLHAQKVNFDNNDVNSVKLGSCSGVLHTAQISVYIYDNIPLTDRMQAISSPNTIAFDKLWSYSSILCMID